MDRTTVLVTGVAGYWGARLAGQLAGEPAYRVVGVDVRAPLPSIPGVDWVRAGARGAVPAGLLAAEAVDTVCHLAAAGEAADRPLPDTIALVEDCARAGVRRLVLKSSTAAYGALPDNPAFLTEEHSLRGGRHPGPLRDLVKVEEFCRAWPHRAAAPRLTILRFAHAVGPTADTPLTRFLRQPWRPGLLGFDPLLQVIHEDDVVRALAHAVAAGVPGIFNVAARPALPLRTIQALAGKPLLAVPHPLAYSAGRLLGRADGSLTPDELRYRCVADLARMDRQLRFVPACGAEEALSDFAARRAPSARRPGRDEDASRPGPWKGAAGDG